MITVLSCIEDTSTTKVLDEMLGNPNTKYNMRSLAKAADVSVSAISKLGCLEKLAEQGIVLVEKKSRREYEICLNKENIVVKQLLKIRCLKKKIEAEDPLLLIDELLDGIRYYYSYSTGAAIYGMSTYRIAIPDIIEVCVLEDSADTVKNRLVGNFEIFKGVINVFRTYSKEVGKQIVFLRKVDEITNNVVRREWLDGKTNVAKIEKVLADCITDMLVSPLCEDFAYTGLLKAKLDGTLDFQTLRKELKSRDAKRLLAYMVSYTNRRYERLFGEKLFGYKETTRAKLTEKTLQFKPILEAQFDELFVY